jgi:hypothetical protein
LNKFIGISLSCSIANNIWVFIFCSLIVPRKAYLPVNENKQNIKTKNEIPKIYPLFFVFGDNKYANIGSNAMKANK